LPLPPISPRFLIDDLNCTRLGSGVFARSMERAMGRILIQAVSVRDNSQR